jgi:hypothetical protein
MQTFFSEEIADTLRKIKFSDFVLDLHGFHQRFLVVMTHESSHDARSF